MTPTLTSAGLAQLQEACHHNIPVDVLSPKVGHETRFCYTYLQELDDYRPSGPPQYTKYT
jgi:hypothetical protein